MHPEFITIGSRTIYWYGVMMALAFLAGIMLWRHLARCTKRPADFGSDLALWVLLPGVIGARILYVVANLPYYRSMPTEIWRIDHGGLIFYGGIIGGAIGAFWFAYRRKEPRIALLDFLVVAIPLGHMFGRIGCFLNGCCYGVPSPDSGFGIAMAGDPTPRVPVQLVEAFGNLLVFLVLYTMYRRHAPTGAVSAFYLLLYPGLRFGLEFLRGDDRLFYRGLTAAQWLSLTLIVCAVLLARHAYRATRRTTLRVRADGSPPAAP